MLSFIRLGKKPYRWFINQSCRRFLEANFIGREASVYEAATKNVLKDNNARTIFSLDIPEMKIIVKRYKIKGLIEMLKATFIPKARQEMKAAAYLIQQHINTVYPLGVMEKRRWGFTTDVFIFLKTIDNVVSLKDSLSRTSSREFKDDTLKLLGEFIRKVHQAKFFHKDLHIGNILMKPAFLKGVEPDLYLIDLHRSSILSYATQSHVVYNLAQMVYSLSRILPLGDAYRFVRYYRELDFRKGFFRDFIRMVFILAEKLRHKHWKSRNKRCLKKSSKFDVMKIEDTGNHLRVFMDKQIAIDDITGLIREHKKVAAQEPEKLFKITSRRLISRIDKSASHLSYSAFVKEYPYSLRYKLRSFLGAHPARREWFAANGLATREIKTAQPVALVEELHPFFRWVSRAYLISREVQAQPTNQFLMRNFIRPIKGRDALKKKTRFIKEFAMAIKLLHQKGIYHHDLKANNILMKDDRGKKRDESNTPLISNLSPFLFYFIDLDRVSFKQEEASAEERLINLAQLNAAVTDVITRADRLRFYRFYSYGEECLPHKDEKEIVKQVMQASIKRRHFWPLQS